MNSEAAQTYTVASLATLVGGEIHGDATLAIHGVADVRMAQPGEIAFVRDPIPSELAKQIQAGALLVTKVLEAPCPQILVGNPHSAFAAVARHFHPLPHATSTEIHPTAVVDSSVTLKGPVRIGPHATVGAGSVLGSGTVIHPGVVIGAKVELGENCTVYPRVTIYDGVAIGARVLIHAGAVLGGDGFGFVIEADGTRNKFPQLGNLVIHDDVEIGANTTLDRSALQTNTIGAGTKIDNLCHIGHNCSVGQNSTISALSAFAAGTHLGDRVIFAGHVVSGGNVKITDDVIVGGNSAVTSDVPKPGSYAGYPLQPRAQAARTAVLHKRLAELQSELRELRKSVEGLLDSTDALEP